MKIPRQPIPVVGYRPAFVFLACCLSSFQITGGEFPGYRQESLASLVCSDIFSDAPLNSDEEKSNEEIRNLLGDLDISKEKEDTVEGRRWSAYAGDVIAVGKSYRIDDDTLPKFEADGKVLKTLDDYTRVKYYHYNGEFLWCDDGETKGWIRKKYFKWPDDPLLWVGDRKSLFHNDPTEMFEFTLDPPGFSERCFSDKHPSDRLMRLLRDIEFRVWISRKTAEEGLKSCERRLQEKDMSSNASLHYLKSRFQDHLKNFPEAIKSIDRAIELEPKNVELQAYRGFIFLRSHSSADLAPQIDELIATSKSDPLPLFLSAAYWSDQQRPQKALLQLSGALELTRDQGADVNTSMSFHPELIDRVFFYQLHLRYSSGQPFDDILAEMYNGKREVSWYGDWARIIGAADDIDQLKYDSAQEGLVSVDSSSINKQILLVKICAESQNWAEAINGLSKADRLEPKNIAIKNNLAWILATANSESSRDPATAIELANDASALADTEEERACCLDTLAAALAASGDFEKAVQAADEASKLSKNIYLRAEYKLRSNIYADHHPWRYAIAPPKDAIETGTVVAARGRTMLLSEGEDPVQIEEGELRTVAVKNEGYLAFTIDEKLFWGKADDFVNSGYLLAQTRNRLRRTVQSGSLARAIQISMGQKNDEMALLLCNSWIELESSAEALNWRANLLSCTTRRELRNLAKAVEDAIKANELTAWKDKAFLRTLAMCYALSDQFEKAIETQMKVVNLAKSTEERESDLVVAELYKASIATQKTFVD